jgi:hypothetical protein
MTRLSISAPKAVVGPPVRQAIPNNIQKKEAHIRRLFSEFKTAV